MLKWELGNLLVRHENVLKEEQKLPVYVRGSKTSVLKLSSVQDLRQTKRGELLNLRGCGGLWEFL